MDRKTRANLLRMRQEAAERRAAEMVEFQETLDRYFPDAVLAEITVWLGKPRNDYNHTVRLKLLTGTGQVSLSGTGLSMHQATMAALRGPEEEDLPF